ncbi:MAG: response regulator transcription factor [Lachnospiraceae bacterium]|jgi:two-component system vancomycin resistance associated response regulator VraR|nr:response regulator transcription factor [Lachnospiraceae bacterium]
MKYKVMIADDYKMIRQMIESVLDSTDRYEVVANATTPEEAVDACRDNDIDLAIIDVVMGNDMDGIEAAARIKTISPHTKILVVTSMAESSYISRSKDAGAESFWHKELQEQPLLEIIDRTMAGESVYPNGTVETWFGETVNTNLTARELDVLRALVHGDSNAEIADKLGITERTVKKHITDMLMKTGFKSRLQLAVRARAGGIAVND